MCLQGGASPAGWHALLSPPWWPSSNLADRIDRPPSTPCRDCPWPLLVPNPASCGCCRRSSPRSRSTTTRPGHHHSSSPQRPCHPDATPREWLQPIIGDHDEIGTPSWAKPMLLWVIIIITAISLLRLGTWQGRIGISAIAIVAVASLAPPGFQPATPGTQGEIAANLAALG